MQTTNFSDLSYVFGGSQGKSINSPLELMLEVQKNPHVQNKIFDLLSDRDLMEKAFHPAVQELLMHPRLASLMADPLFISEAIKIGRKCDDKLIKNAHIYINEYRLRNDEDY